MFSMFKKSSDKEEVVLSELSEGQLSQVAGGSDWSNDNSYSGSSSSSDSWNKWQAPKKHHKHKHKMWKKMTSGSDSQKWNSWSEPTKW